MIIGSVPDMTAPIAHNKTDMMDAILVIAAEGATVEDGISFLAILKGIFSVKYQQTMSHRSI
jgi:hypothetical protein